MTRALDLEVSVSRVLELARHAISSSEQDLALPSRDEQYFEETRLRPSLFGRTASLL